MAVTRSASKGRTDPKPQELPAKRQRKKGGTWTSWARDWAMEAKSLFTSPSRIFHLGLLCVVAEAALCVFIIRRIKYTEIDWVTYMAQVKMFLNGTTDYALISGPTGPIPYPAGHVWVYSLLYYVTDSGVNIVRAQYIFAGLYVATLVFVFAIYAIHGKIPPYAFLFMCFGGYRIHSLYVLRLFNDPIASLIAFAAILCFLKSHWLVGCVLFSLAVSVKMNILLYAPGLFFVLLATNGRLRTFGLLIVCALVQVLVALPFLQTYPMSYLTRAFNLGRVFEFKWTVNFRFLGEALFVDRRVHMALLLGHVVALILFAWHTWLRPIGGIKALRKDRVHQLSPHEILFPLWTSNFIGMAFARSLHYQFYSWYYHSLLFLLFATPFPPVMNLATLGLVELVWNTYPSTSLSSAALHGLHAVILIGLTAKSALVKTSKAKAK